jgi:murein DD-endopeptidase MepM/ murein hydrolase activator NlpD
MLNVRAIGRAARGPRVITVVVAVVVAIVTYAIWDGERQRALLRDEIRALRGRLAARREQLSVQGDEVAKVAEAVEQVARTAAELAARVTEVRRLANMEDGGAPMSSLIPASGDGAEALLFSEDAAQALERLAVVDQQLASTADSLTVLMALLRERPEAELSVPSLWPVRGMVTSRYGMRRSPYGGRRSEMHPGIDIKAQQGYPVTASADGEVIFAGWDPGYGRLVVLAHGGEVDTFYGHLSAFYVREGQRVQRGEPIGAVGATGRATGAHLHYEVRVRNRPVDPTRYLVN